MTPSLKPDDAGRSDDAKATLRSEFVRALDAQLAALGAPAVDAPAGCCPGRWWWEDEEGQVLLKLYFRGLPLQPNGAADTALLQSLDQVRFVLEGVRCAALDGQLDAQFFAAAEER